MNCNTPPKCDKPCGDCTQEWPVPAGAQSPAEGDELPPLPEPAHSREAPDHTADQMREYARAALGFKAQPKGTATDLAVFGSGPFHVETRTNAHAEICNTQGRAVAHFSWSVDATARANALCALLNSATRSPAPAPDADPLFLLHCGQIDSSGEQDDWDIEADSGKRVEEFCRLHPGQTVNLYPHVQYPAVVDGKPFSYSSTQATNCASCGKHKHTPLRIDAMGGYVCLTCIDKKLGGLLGEFGYEDDQQRVDAEKYRHWRDNAEVICAVLRYESPVWIDAYLAQALAERDAAQPPVQHKDGA